MIDRYSYPQMKDMWSDKAKFDTFLKVEILACEAWAKLGRIPEEALVEIKDKAKFNLERVLEIEKTTNHDVIAFISAVAENVGDSSRYIHIGMTSSDVIDTSYCYMMKQAMELLIEDIDGMIEVVRQKAKVHKYDIIVGRSHGIHAEPTTFGLKMLIFLDELTRGRDRLLKARDVISVGKISGPVGTYAEIPPEIEEYICKSLGLKRAKVSNQIIQRDRHAEYLGAIALVGTTLEKLATEIRALQRTEIGEVSEPFAKGQKGSSAMPHKKNPILCERICGMARVLRGNALAAMENVTLWHERDISHSSAERIIVPDSTILLDYMLRKFTDVMQNLIVNTERMKENLELTRGLLSSGKVLLALVDAGMLRDDAYALVQRNSMRVWDGKEHLLDLLLNDPEVTSKLNQETIKKCFDYSPALKYVDEIFERFGM